MTKIIAHRGYSKAFPENTLLAFKQAIAYPIDGIELDVQLTKDNVPVICHDETIDRTSNGNGWIKDMTLKDLKNCSFHYHFDTYYNHPECRLLTLEKFLNWAKPYNFMINIELKTDIIKYEKIEAIVLQLIDQFDINPRIILSSFNHESLRTAKKLNPDLAIGFLNATGILDPGDYCSKYQARHYHPHYRSLTPAAISNCQSQNIDINTYTVNDADTMTYLNKMGVTRIFTDDLPLAAATLL